MTLVHYLLQCSVVWVFHKTGEGYGDKIKGYHAWNEVYLAGKWLIIDTSFDVQMFQDMRHTSIFKDNSMYKNK